jgi:serine/threonine protein kinase
MTLDTGQVLNQRYRVVNLLGQGGFGAVYRAWDMKLRGPCALKENFNTSPEAQKQFDREASMLFNLRHPGLPRVFDSFVVPGKGQYLVMDFIEGEDLQQWLQRSGGPLAEVQVLVWIRQICNALSYMHSQNPPIIHRDIKPANIKITPAGEAVLVDFGIAKLHNPDLQTTVGARAITPGYSPQEQYGQGQTDARSDVYALGATLYTLLAGREPLESIERGLGKPLTAPISINPSISRSTDQAIMKAMEMIPERRFASMADFKAALVMPATSTVEKVVQPNVSHGERKVAPPPSIAPVQAAAPVRAAAAGVVRQPKAVKNSNAAVLSLLCGILGMALLLPSAILIFASGVFAIFAGAVNLALGIGALIGASRAKKQIYASNGALGGEKLASAGRAMGWIVVVLYGLSLCAFCGLVMIGLVSGNYSWMAPGLAMLMP